MAGQQVLSLHVISGVLEGKEFEFKGKKKVTVGRTRGNALQIKDDTVSQKHAVFEYKSEQWFLTDLESSNGTAINGAFVNPGVAVSLENGDLLGIGAENEVRVTIDEPLKGATVSEPPKEEERRGLTVKEWFALEKVRMAAEAASKAESTVRELVEQTEALKMQICESSGVDYASISCLKAP